MLVSKILLVLTVGAAMAGAGAFASRAAQAPRVRVDVLIIGLVPCSNGTSMKIGASPPFPNAAVQVQCRGGAMGNGRTDGRGWFRIARSTTAALPSIVRDCKLVVSTPLASCNSSFPATGALRSPLRRLAATAVLFPTGFSYVA